MDGKDKDDLERVIRIGVSEGELSDAISEGTIDNKSKALLQLELDQMESRLERTGHAGGTGKKIGNLMGLCLSGGGFRSATFNLGVLQMLAARGWLKRVDFLSTVSGGSYLGSALTWWASGKADREGDTPLGDSADDFPYGADSRNPRLKHLREHGNWLIPGDGIDLVAGLAVVLRGILVNLAIWFPLVACAMYFMYLRIPMPEWLNLTALTDWNGLYELLGVSIEGMPPNPNVYELSFWVSVALVLPYLLLGCLLYSLATGFVHRGVVDRQLRGLSFLPSRYQFRRFAEIASGLVFKIIIIGLVVAAMPVIIFKLHGYLNVVGPAAAFAGLLSAGWAFLRTRSDGKGVVPFGLIVTIAAALLIFGILLMANTVAFWLHCNLMHVEFAGFCEIWKGTSANAAVPDPTIRWWFRSITGASFVFALVVNLNYVSLHRFYRDRLMEAFMPSREDADAGRTAPAKLADKARLSKMWNAGRDNMPYHLINTNVVLVNSKNHKYRMRGGDSFLLSPLYCGSTATGWTATRDFMGDGLSLPSAMAISGAAANPNTGTGGTGLTRNRLVSVLMALMNVQLGYWVRRPRSRWIFTTPTHILPGLYILTGWLFGRGFRENSRFLQISDGGHFENLGLYELIRRRMRLIVLCDAGADPNFSFEDLEIAVTRIRQDFGTELRFHRPQMPGADSAHPVEALVAGASPAFPKAEDLADSSHILADIDYPGGGKGLLVMLKTTLTRDLPVEVLAYKAANPDFPDQTTADQFFDESQFEAYRLLGVAAATSMMNNDQVQKAVELIYGPDHLP